MYQYPDYLMHYGVLGMKWGRRKRYLRIKRNEKIYDKSVNEFRKMIVDAKKHNLQPGTIVSSKTGTKLEVTNAGYKWLSGNKQLQQMPIDDLMAVIHYKNYNEIPDW